MQHSKIGASSCERWWNCPGSIALNADIPRETSEYAEEGSLAHQIGEHCLKARIDPGQVSELEGKKITKEMTDAVQVYYDTIVNDLNAYYPSGTPINALLIEQKFHLKHIDKDAFGTNDACFIQPFEKITIYDYKHGKGVAVEVKDNKQLMYYALGALAMCTAEVHEIEMVIVQPRCHHVVGPVRRWSISVEELERFGQDLKKAIARTKKKNAKLCVGDWCKFCPAKQAGKCSAIHKQVMETVKQDFRPVDQWELKPVDQMTPEEISKILGSASMITDWVKTVMSYAHTQVEKGKHIPGFKLVKKRAVRKWGDEKEVIAQFENTYGLKMYEVKLKSPTQMEKVVPKSELDTFIVKPDNGTVLVPADDKRQEVQSSVEADFKPVKQSENLDLFLT